MYIYVHIYITRDVQEGLSRVNPKSHTAYAAPWSSRTPEHYALRTIRLRSTPIVNEQ